MYDFDEVIERKGSSSVKWDIHKERQKPEDVISMWVADMDFKAPKKVIEALTYRVEHGVYGYSVVDEPYKQAVCSWMGRRHDWEIKAEWIVATPGVVAALKIAINEFTNKGDAIIIQKPVYYPFDMAIEQNDRLKIDNPVIFNGISYDIDFEDFQQKIIDNNVKMYILCNPYNPIGKVWKKAELQRIGDICKKHGVLVISDEIHHDFVYGNHRHIPFTQVDPTFKDFTIICTSPSKSFNLAGLQVSNIIIENNELRERFQQCCMKLGFEGPNLFGLTACKVAYNECEDWLEEMLRYVKDNFEYLDKFFKTKLPQIKLVEPEGLYLAWVDFRALKMDYETLERFMLQKAKLWLDEGYIFGQEGAGYERFNLATPRPVLKEALIRLESAIKQAGLL